MVPAAEPVASGQGYTISHVDGHRPKSWDDFVGDIHLTLLGSGQHLDITGEVARTADSVGSTRGTLRSPIETSGFGSSPPEWIQRGLRNRSKPCDQGPPRDR